MLITGGSRGLGLILAHRLAGEGANIILCARDENELQRAKDQLSQYPVKVLAVPCDVTNETAVLIAIRHIQTECGTIDVLINNAGVIQCGPMDAMTFDDYEQAIETHLYGPLRMTEAVLPEMRRLGSGRIVNISSIGGLVSFPHLLPYSASKFALVGYSLGLANEVAKDGVLVTTVCPGLMRTGSARNAVFKGKNRVEYTLFKISDSLPVLSMSAERAARKIVDACRYGDSFVVLGCTAKLAAKVAAVAPRLTATALGLVNRMLPGYGGIGSQHARGFESNTSLSESWLTRLTDNAALRNNEV